MYQRAGVIKLLPGKAGMLNPSQLCIDGLYSSTGMEEQADPESLAEHLLVPGVVYVGSVIYMT